MVTQSNDCGYKLEVCLMSANQEDDGCAADHAATARGHDDTRIQRKAITKDSASTSHR